MACQTNSSQRIEFNAHRVFAAEMMIEWFSDGWEIERYAVIDDMKSVREGPAMDVLTNFKGKLEVEISAARKNR